MACWWFHSAAAVVAAAAAVVSTPIPGTQSQSGFEDERILPPDCDQEVLPRTSYLLLLLLVVGFSVVSGSALLQWQRSKYALSLVELTAAAARPRSGWIGGLALRCRLLLLLAVSSFSRAVLTLVVLLLLLLPPRGAESENQLAAAAYNLHTRQDFTPSPMQCISLNIWMATVFRFGPSVISILIFLLLGAFLTQLYAAATLQRSRGALLLALAVPFAGFITFLIAAGFSFNNKSEHIFQRLSYFDFGFVYSFTAIILATFGILLLIELRKRDAQLREPLLQLASQQQRSEPETSVAAVTFLETAIGEDEICSFANRGVPIGVGALPGAMSVHVQQQQHAAASRNAMDWIAEDARMRLLILTTCCPPLLLLVGVYLLTVGLQGRHMYPLSVEKHRQQVTFDGILLFIAELLPAVIVLKICSPSKRAAPRSSSSSSSSSTVYLSSSCHRFAIQQLIPHDPGNNGDSTGDSEGNSISLQTNRQQIFYGMRPSNLLEDCRPLKILEHQLAYAICRSGSSSSPFSSSKCFTWRTALTSSCNAAGREPTDNLCLSVHDTSM